MATNGEVFLGAIADANRTLSQLTHDHFEPDQIREILSSVGARSEIFLKAVLLPNLSSKKTFANFIDLLPASSINQINRSAIHGLRNLYNKAKHEPLYRVELLEALVVIRGAELGFKQVVACGVGLSADRYAPSVQRVYWLSACDHYTGGETEVHIHIPGKSNHWLGVPTFDRINVLGPDWDDIKVELSAIGTLRSAEGIIPQTQYDAFISEGDSLTPLVFEGTYKNLLTVLTSHEIRLDLIPGLRREDSKWSMTVAVLMAACDVALTCSDRSQLSKELQRHATREYGVPHDYQFLSEIIDGIIELFAQLPLSDWRKLRGPIWVSELSFSDWSQKAIARHLALSIIVGENHEIIVEWSHQ